MQTNIQDSNIEETIKVLIKLKDSLIKIVADTESKDLNRKFMELAGENPSNMELFQTLMLMQDISRTSHKNFKDFTIEIINILINHKIDSLNMIRNINNRLETFENIDKKDSIITLPVIGVIKKKDLLQTLLTVFLVLFIAYSINPEAADSAITGMKNLGAK